MTHVHSFMAFIDEAGDEGFKFREPPHEGSSRWFILSAVVVRASNELSATRIINTTIKPIEKARKKYVHFSSLKHEERVPVAFAIARAPLRLISICTNKAALPDDHGLHSERRLYFWSTRLLLERVSWLARDNRTEDGLSGRCGLVFSHCKRLSYDNLRDYLGLLQTPMGPKTEISWDHLSINDFAVLPHSERVGLKAADAVASGLRLALDLSPHGFCEDRFARMYQPITYCRNGNYLSYGLKIGPGIPAPEPARDYRYGWIQRFVRRREERPAPS